MDPMTLEVFRSRAVHRVPVEGNVHFGISIGFDRANPDPVDFLTKPASEGGLVHWSCDARGAARTAHPDGVPDRVRVRSVPQPVRNCAGFEKFLQEFGGDRTAAATAGDGEGNPNESRAPLAVNAVLPLVFRACVALKVVA